MVYIVSSTHWVCTSPGRAGGKNLAQRGIYFGWREVPHETNSAHGRWTLGIGECRTTLGSPTKDAYRLRYCTLVSVLSALYFFGFPSLESACQFQRPPLSPFLVSFSHRSSEMHQPQQSGGQQPSSPTEDPPLHPEIRSIVSLSLAHREKTYFSGPLIHKVDRNPDGNKPHKDEGWREAWAQLSGTTLSIWDMEEVKIANQQGKEVPPSYINITEAVRAPFHLHYLHGSTKPSFSVRSRPRCSNTASDTDIPLSQVH